MFILQPVMRFGHRCTLPGSVSRIPSIAEGGGTPNERPRSAEQSAGDPFVEVSWCGLQSSCLSSVVRNLFMSSEQAGCLTAQGIVRREVGGVGFGRIHQIGRPEFLLEDGSDGRMTVTVIFGLLIQFSFRVALACRWPDFESRR